MRIPLQTRLSIFEAQNEHYSNWHSFAPTMATRLGAAPYNPMLATLGGYAYMLTLASTLFVPGVSNTLGDSALCC
jgi:hypothetical protein